MRLRQVSIAIVTLLLAGGAPSLVVADDEVKPGTDDAADSSDSPFGSVLEIDPAVAPAVSGSAWLQATPVLFWTRDGRTPATEADDDSDAPRRYAVYAAPGGDRVRIELPGYEATFAAWVDRDALLPAVATDHEVTVGESGARAIVRSGALAEPSGEATRYTPQLDPTELAVDLSIELPASGVAPVAPTSALPVVPDAAPLKLEAGVRILAEPSEDAVLVARVGDMSVSASPVSATSGRDGYTFVRAIGNDVVVDGWVDDEILAEASEWKQFTVGGLGGWGVGGGTYVWATLAGGTLLYDRPDGTPVGNMIKDASVLVVSEDEVEGGVPEGWTRVRTMAMNWSWVDTWVPSAEVVEAN